MAVAPKHERPEACNWSAHQAPWSQCSARPSAQRSACSAPLIRWSYIWIAVLASVLCVPQLLGAAASPDITRFTLDNGLPVSIIHVPDELVFCVFTWIPSSLGTDDPGHAGWMRLVSRLSSQTAGETRDLLFLDGTGLESWSRSKEWEQTLAGHARAFKGYEFTDRHFRLFHEDAEIAPFRTDAGGAPLDAALCVFAQSYRYGLKHVSVRDDITKASVTEVRAYAKARWRQLAESRLCVIGDVPVERLRAKIVECFGSLERGPTLSPAKGGMSGRDLQVTWDGNTYLLACAWPLGDLTVEDRAGLLVVAEVLGSDSATWLHPEVSCLAVCGLIRLPEGDSFVVIVASDMGEVLPEIGKQVKDRVGRLRDRRWDQAALEKARDLVRDQFLLPKVPWIEDPAVEPNPYQQRGLLKKLLDIRRTWSRIEWRYGDQRTAVGRKLAELTPERVAAVVAKCLSEDRRVSCTVKPKSPEPER